MKSDFKFNKTQKILLIVALIYVVMGLVTGIIFFANGSYIQQSDEKEVMYDFKQGGGDGLVEEPIPSEAPTEEDIANAIESDSAAVTEEDSQDEGEVAEESGDDSEYLDTAVNEEPAGDDSGAEAAGADEKAQEEDKEDKEAETVSENEAEEEPAEKEEFVATDGVFNKHYYIYTVNAGGVALNMRQEPYMDGKIVAKIADKTSGYVMVIGDKWSLVTNGVSTGYVLNDYIVLTQITEEAFPAAYR